MSDFESMFPALKMPVVVGSGMVMVGTPNQTWTFNECGELMQTLEHPPENDPPDVYRDENGYRRSRDTCQCGWGHTRDGHDETGQCQSGDDDGDGYFDQCYCTEFRSRRL